MRIIVPVIKRFEGDNTHHPRYETKKIVIEDDFPLSTNEMEELLDKYNRNNEENRGEGKKQNAVTDKITTDSCYYLEEEDVYAEYLMLLSGLFNYEYGVIKKDFENARKEMVSSDYSKCARKVNQLQRDLTSMKSYISESIAIIGEDIRECKVNDKRIEAEYFIKTRNLLRSYEESVESHLQEVLTYSDIEIMKNNHHMSEIIEMFSAITILGLIPTIIFSFYGINVGGEHFFDNTSFLTIMTVTIFLMVFVLIIVASCGFLIPKKIKDSPHNEEKGRINKINNWIDCKRDRVNQGLSKVSNNIFWEIVIAIVLLAIAVGAVLLIIHSLGPLI